jgi:hypothetical protein
VKRFAPLFAPACFAFLALTIFVSMGTAQSANRLAVVHQALYALSASANGTSSQTLNGNYVGNWNWLDSDFNSYNAVKGYYNYLQNGSWTCYPSNFAISGDPCPNLTGHPVSSFYSNPGGYGYSPIVPEVSYGRGGQCVYFANLVVYRAGFFTGTFPSLPNMSGNGNSNMQQVQIGDVIVRYATAYVNHVAIVVQIHTNPNGSVASVDVVDSDFFPDYVSGISFPEVITRHNFTISQLQGYFKIWNVPGY